MSFHSAQRRRAIRFQVHFQGAAGAHEHALPHDLLPGQFQSDLTDLLDGGAELRALPAGEGRGPGSNGTETYIQD
ncbi:MAG: hypothetical protein B1H04_06150 [Planctomycetales bacterium 4484_123]|nr:MAG: hypothetical protein B1H04_06150 [Planctomycetales bacterium 4484_123]